VNEYRQNKASNDNGAELIGKVIESDHGLTFKIISFGRRENTVLLKSERDGQEFELNIAEARIMLA
jgi:hypothetical protein